MKFTFNICKKLNSIVWLFGIWEQFLKQGLRLHSNKRVRNWKINIQQNFHWKIWIISWFSMNFCEIFGKSLASWNNESIESKRNQFWDNIFFWNYDSSRSILIRRGIQNYYTLAIKSACISAPIFPSKLLQLANWLLAGSSKLDRIIGTDICAHFLASPL